MKKLGFMVFAAVFGLFLAACGGNREDKSAIFIEDLDYMLHTLENNFALFDVANWAHGVDITAIAENIRTEISNNTYMSMDEFYLSLLHNFAPLTDIGHFRIITPNNHHRILNNVVGAYEWWVFPRTSTVRLTYPHVLEFYEPRHYMITPWTDWSIETFIYRSILFGEEALAEDFAQAVHQGNYHTANQLLQQINEIKANTPNTRMEIIDEGRIAYLSIDSFMHLCAAQEIQILNLFEEIRDFDHLIVDLRRNLGGSPSVFYHNVMGPNIDSLHTLEGFAFLSYGEYASEFFAARPGSITGMHLDPVANLQTRDRELRTTEEMLRDFDLPDLNPADMRRMDYGFTIQTQIRPRRLPQFDNQPAFNGEIWLLTGPLMGSAAQISAWAAKDANFATLVGDVTGGNYGGPRIFVALPNTGIMFQMDMFYVTDCYGRPLEAGTIPHHFNREGMDALETTLALIEEGNY